MRTAYLTAATSGEVHEQVAALRVRTAVVDVEPLVAFWDTGQDVLQRGLTLILDTLADTGLQVVVFATNSTRRPPSPPSEERMHVDYRAAAGKPLRVAAYRDLPLPGVVIGDQVATDGVLAWRLGYTFLHYTPDLPAIPPGPRLMRHLGRPIRPCCSAT